MSETAKTIVNQAIVRSVDVDRIVEQFDLIRLAYAIEPEGLALVRAREDERGLVRELRDAGWAADHNYVLAALTHAHFFPISFPRPGPPGTLANEDKADVQIVAIDSKMLTNSPLDGVVIAGDKKGLKNPANTSSAEVHGTLVAGVLAQLAPRAQIEVLPAADPDNDNMVSDYELACQLVALASRPRVPDIVNLSLGASMLVEEPVASRAALRKLMRRPVTVFAAVGNDGLAEIAYPASLPGVVSVGGQAREKGRRRKADFSNSDPDVDLWAPAVDITAPIVREKLTFRPVPQEHQDRFKLFRDLPPSTPNPQPFSNGWAKVDGTSFAAPQMAACMANLLIASHQGDPEGALGQLEEWFGDRNNQSSCGGYATA